MLTNAGYSLPFIMKMNSFDIVDASVKSEIVNTISRASINVKDNTFRFNLYHWASLLFVAVQQLPGESSKWFWQPEETVGVSSLKRKFEYFKVVP